MQNKRQIRIIKILSFLKVIDVTVKKNGFLETNGANKWNPLSWIIAIPLIIMGGAIGFYDEIIEYYRAIFKKIKLKNKQNESTNFKKMIKEGVSPRTGNEYKIRSLFVKFTDSKIYDKIVAKLKKDGADEEQIERFCKPSEYNGEVNYAFGLNCSKFTFERVQAFGELDALIDFNLNDSGFINAKIAIKDRVEQVLDYIEPTGSAEEIVEGWAMKGDLPKPAEKSELETESTNTEVIPPMPIPTAEEDEFELPF